MMTTDAFLARIGTNHFFRALWPKKSYAGNVEQGLNPAPPPDDRWQVTIGYGPWSPAFATRCAELNRQGYGIYFGANDPGPGKALTEANVETLRCIYRECDVDAEPSPLDMSEGRRLTLAQPHLHWLTSAKRSQSIWLIEPISSVHINQIHGEMVRAHAHDRDAAGAHRLLRLPGYVNTKHAERPVSAVVATSDTAILPAAAILRRFRLSAAGPAKVDGNLSRSMHAMQSGSGGAASTSNYALKQAWPAHGATSPGHERQIRDIAHTGIDHNQPSDEVRQALGDVDPYERSDWRTVGACLHFMFQGSDDGLMLFDAWSRLAPAKHTVGCCDKEWAGFKDSHAHPAHWGSLKAMSRQRMGTAAARARAKALEGVFALLSPRLSIQTLVPRFPETRAVGDTARLEPVANSVANAEYVFDCVEPTLHYDEFAGEEHTSRGSYSDKDMNAVYVEGMRMGLKWTKAFCEACGEVYAQTNKRNMALDFYGRLEGTWDGVKRLDKLFIDHLGAADQADVQEVTRLTFVAMVRRILQPGCKYDYMLVLHGRGGIGKSAIFKRLMPEANWFSDAPSMTEEPKRFYMMLQGKLCIEFAELDGMPSADIGRMKKMVTQEVNEFVGMYKTKRMQQPRIGVFIGTTNDQSFLRDMTGNRRFPVVHVTKKLSFNAIDAVRDQIWAEAIEAEKSYGVLEMSEATAQAIEQKQHQHKDYEENVLEFLDRIDGLYEGLIANATFQEAFGITADKRDRLQSSRIRYAIKQAKAQMIERGWKVTENPVWIGGKTKRGLYKLDLCDKLREIVYSEPNGLHHTPEGMEQ